MLKAGVILTVLLVGVWGASLCVRASWMTHGPAVGPPAGPAERAEAHYLFGHGSLSYVTLRVGSVRGFDTPSFDTAQLAWRTQDDRWFRPYYKHVSGRGTIGVLPLWIPAAGVGGATLLLGVRRLLRGRAGRCAGCGYDRAGLAPSAACPECGRVVAAPSPRTDAGVGQGERFTRNELAPVDGQQVVNKV